MSNKKLTFANPARDLVVIATVTNWSEAPRIRHEVAHQLSRFYNVLFVQLYCQRGMSRKILKFSDSLIVTRVGMCFPGMLRVLMRSPIFMSLYNFSIKRSLEILVKQHSRNKAILINFQFNAPEINDSLVFYKCIYFCNEDFINQQLNSSIKEKNLKARMQSKVISKSNVVFTVSEPLLEKLKLYGAKNIYAIHSAHKFNLNYSRNNSYKRNYGYISVCYMGFLNQYINIDWLNAVSNNSGMHLTIVGSITYSRLSNLLKKNKQITFIQSLTGLALQIELLKHDVLIMPYSSPVDNEVTSVPAKLYQYLAVGKPIVSSKMPNLKKFPDKTVFQAENKKDFISLILQASISDSNELRLMRINLAEGNTWDARGDFIHNIIEEL